MFKRIELLEEKVQRQEVLLAEHEARLTGTGTGHQPPTPPGINQILAMPNLALQSPAQHTDHLHNVDFGNGTSTNTLDLMNQPPSSSFMTTQSGPSASPSGLSTASFADPNVLPSHDIVHDLLNLFWTHIHPWAPFLSPNSVPLHPPWNIVVHAIVVVTIRLSSDPRLEGKHEMYKRAAKQHVVSHAIESTSLASVQALALLALDLIGSEQGPSSWGILALLTRSAVHLGLTTEDDSNAHGGSLTGARPPAPSLSRTSIIPPAADWREDECRRRLFWLIFSLDRYACASTGWDFALPDMDISRRLPCSDERWSANVSTAGVLSDTTYIQEWFSAPMFRPIPHLITKHDSSSVSPFAYLVEALDLLGRAHTLQSQNIDPGDVRAVERRRDSSVSLSSAAQMWFSSLPWETGIPGAMGLMIVSRASWTEIEQR